MTIYKYTGTGTIEVGIANDGSGDYVISKEIFEPNFTELKFCSFEDALKALKEGHSIKCFAYPDSPPLFLTVDRTEVLLSDILANDWEILD